MLIHSKKALLPVVLISAVVLTGCYQNPMTQHNHKKTITVLHQAARDAEKQLGLERTIGGSYGLCMSDEPEKAGVDCVTLFKTMLPWVQKNPAFKHMTLAHLSDKEAFEPLAEDYDMDVFYSI